MHEIPETFDPSFMVGHSLGGVVVGRHQHVLSFCGSLSICVEEDLLVVLADGKTVNISLGSWEGLPALFDCISHDISAASVVPPHELRIDMSNGSSIVLHSVKGRYESFSISLGEGEWPLVV